MKRENNPGSYDGKKVGAACGIHELGQPRPGPRWGRGLRRAAFYGNVKAQRTLAEHARKWLGRGMTPENVAKKLGVTWVEVRRWTDTTLFDPTPRLKQTK